MSFRFSRQARITNAQDYRAIFQKGKRLKGRYWEVVAKPGEGQASRLGMAISKKTCRLSSHRNRLKRVAKEVFRHEQGLLKKWEFVVMARVAKPKASRELSSELKTLLHEITN